MKLTKKMKYILSSIELIGLVSIPTSIALVSCSSNDDNYLDNLDDPNIAPINIDSEQYTSFIPLIYTDSTNNKNTEIYSLFENINNNSDSNDFNQLDQEQLFNYFLVNLNKNSYINYYTRGPGLDNGNFLETNKSKKFVCINSFDYDLDNKKIDMNITFSKEYYFQKLSKDDYDPNIIYDWNESYIISYTLNITNLYFLPNQLSTQYRSFDTNCETTHINYDSLIVKLDYSNRFNAIEQEYNNLLKNNHIDQNAYDRKMSEINEDKQLVNQLNSFFANYDNILNLNPGNRDNKTYMNEYGGNLDTPFIDPSNISVDKTISGINELLPGIGYKLNTNNEYEFYSTYFQLSPLYYINLN